MTSWCEANNVDYILGLPGNAVLSRLIEIAADDVRLRPAEAEISMERPMGQAPPAVPVRNSSVQSGRRLLRRVLVLLTAAVLIAPTSMLTLLDLLLDPAECLVGTADGANEGGAALHECVQTLAREPLLQLDESAGISEAEQLLLRGRRDSRALRNVIRACEETFGTPLLWPDAEDAAGCHRVNYTPEYGTRNVCASRPTRPG